MIRRSRKQVGKKHSARGLQTARGVHRPVSTADHLFDERCCSTLQSKHVVLCEEGKLDAPRTTPGLDQATTDRVRSRSRVKHLPSVSMGKVSFLQYQVGAKQLQPQKPNRTISSPTDGTSEVVSWKSEVDVVR